MPPKLRGQQHFCSHFTYTSCFGTCSTPFKRITLIYISALFACRITQPFKNRPSTHFCICWLIRQAIKLQLHIPNRIAILQVLVVLFKQCGEYRECIYSVTKERLCLGPRRRSSSTSRSSARHGYMLGLRRFTRRRITVYRWRQRLRMLRRKG